MFKSVSFETPRYISRILQETGSQEQQNQAQSFSPLLDPNLHKTAQYFPVKPTEFHQGLECEAQRSSPQAVGKTWQVVGIRHRKSNMSPLLVRIFAPQRQVLCASNTTQAETEVLQATGA